jgi:hypothetical protein
MERTASIFRVKEQDNARNLQKKAASRLMAELMAG